MAPEHPCYERVSMLKAAPKWRYKGKTTFQLASNTPLGKGLWLSQTY